MSETFTGIAHCLNLSLFLQACSEALAAKAGAVSSEGKRSSLELNLYCSIPPKERNLDQRQNVSFPGHDTKIEWWHLEVARAPTSNSFFWLPQASLFSSKLNLASAIRCRPAHKETKVIIFSDAATWQHLRSFARFFFGTVVDCLAWVALLRHCFKLRKVAQFEGKCAETESRAAEASAPQYLKAQLSKSAESNSSRQRMEADFTAQRLLELTCEALLRVHCVAA